MRRVQAAAVPAVLIGIAIMGVVANTLLVRAATGSDGFASDPGYYERGLAWDAQLLERGDAQRLGVATTVELLRSGEHDARLCARLEGPDGRVLNDAVVASAASANLCPQRRIESTLTATADGYCSTISDACPGVWRIDIRARIGDATVAESRRVELRGAP